MLLVLNFRSTFLVEMLKDSARNSQAYRRLLSKQDLSDFESI